MARHKSKFADYDIVSSSDEDSDDSRVEYYAELEERAQELGVSMSELLEEDELFRDPIARKRARRLTKEDRIYGIFNEDNDEEDEISSSKTRIHMSKDIKFVASSSSTSKQQNEETSDDEASSDAMEQTYEKEASYEEEEEMERPALGLGAGLGFKSTESTERPSLGLGSKPSTEKSAWQRSTATFHMSGQDTIPTAFGSPRQKNNAARRGNGGVGNYSRHGKNAADTEKIAEWTKHTTGIGLKLMQKMGYKIGSGLGARGEGIAQPIETKLRPGKIGIAYGGFKEKTKQAREDEIRKGLVVESDEEMADKEDIVPGWMKVSREGPGRKASRKKKTKYRTIDQVIAEAERTSVQANQKVIDYTGPQARTITPADIRSTPTGRATSIRFMELRHNLELLTNMAREDVTRCGREKRILEAQQSEAQGDAERLEAIVNKKSQELTRLEQVAQLVATCHQLARDAMQSETNSMDIYRATLDKLLNSYSIEYRQLELDSLLVALLSPIMRKELADWEPLAEPTRFLDEIKQWRCYLRTCTDPTTGWGASAAITTSEDQQIGLLQHFNVPTPTQTDNLVMTAYDSMMYHIWLPRVRSAINNTWDPRDPDPAIALMEAWQPPILPPFMFTSICNQVLIPKLHHAIDDWDPRRDPVGVHTWLHPWLPLMSDAMEDLWTPIRHKLTVALQRWHPSDVSALSVISPWHGVFREADMNALLTNTIIPKLTMALRVELVINPQQQDLAPLEWVLAWLPLIGAATIAQMLEKEFFPKWLDILRLWLQGKPNYDEVTEWYMYWRQLFPEEIREHARIQDGFRRGLDLMNQTIA